MEYCFQYSTPMHPVIHPFIQILYSLQTNTSELLTAGGLLTLGEWQAAPDAVGYSVLQSFQGALDNVLVWQGLLLPSLVRQTYKLDPNLYSHRDGLVYAYR